MKENNINKNTGDKSVITSGNIKFTEVKERQNIYKKITKKDFVLAFMFSFLFVFTIYSVDNQSGFKADLFDDAADTEDLIYDGEESREFKPTLSFYPENTAIENGIREENENIYLDYYVLETPDDIVEISLDNVVSNPTCANGRKYKFQGTTKYLELGESVNETDTAIYGANYPVLSTQDGINANYKISSNNKKITIYFDKDISNGKYYNFALKDGITIYSDYRDLTKFEATNLNVSIDGNELILSFDNELKSNFGRITISPNLIADLDGRINDKGAVVGKKIEGEIVIDNKKPTCTISGNNTKEIKFQCDENITENPNKSIENSITDLGPNYSEYDINGDTLSLYFTEDTTLDTTLPAGTVSDYNGNLN